MTGLAPVPTTVAPSLTETAAAEQQWPWMQRRSARLASTRNVAQAQAAPAAPSFAKPKPKPFVMAAQEQWPWQQRRSRTAAQAPAPAPATPIVVKAKPKPAVRESQEQWPWVQRRSCRRRRQSDRRILGSSAPNALRARLGPGVNLRSMFSHWLWAPGPKTTSPRLRRAQPTGARWRACGGLAEFASRCFRRSPRRSSSQRHRSGVGFAFRKIGAWRRGRRGSLHAEEERAVRRPGQGRSARFCASSTATSAARHEPVPIIEA